MNGNREENAITAEDLQLHQKETSIQVFFCEFCGIFKDTYFMNVSERLILESKISCSSLYLLSFRLLS